MEQSLLPPYQKVKLLISSCVPTKRRENSMQINYLKPLQKFIEKKNGEERFGGLMKKK